MAASPSFFRTWVALIALALVAGTCLSLGNWQLRRASERDAIRRSIAEGSHAAPIALTAHTPSSDLIPWRKARADGIWLHEFTVLLDNRNFKGRPGYWVATPLLLDASSRDAVLVLRGWLPRPILPGQSLPPLPRPEGRQAVEGQMASHVPRMFELWSRHDSPALPANLPNADRRPPIVQNLALEDLARATGLQLIPVVLEETPADGKPSASPPFIQEWPLPPIDSDQNRGYALQWFGFAAIAGIAFVTVAWKAWRRRGPPAPR